MGEWLNEPKETQESRTQTQTQTQDAGRRTQDADRGTPTLPVAVVLSALFLIFLITDGLISMSLEALDYPIHVGNGLWARGDVWLMKTNFSSSNVYLPLIG
jgi:hypothetical protein